MCFPHAFPRQFRWYTSWKPGIHLSRHRNRVGQSVFDTLSTLSAGKIQMQRTTQHLGENDMRVGRPVDLWSRAPVRCMWSTSNIHYDELQASASQRLLPTIGRGRGASSVTKRHRDGQLLTRGVSFSNSATMTINSRSKRCCTQRAPQILRRGFKLFPTNLSPETLLAYIG